MKNLISRGISALTPVTRRRRNTSQPATEALEDRVLLSNVTVSFENGDLRLQGDSGDNVVTVEQHGDRIIVQGFNGTELNGRSQSLLFATNGVRDDVIMNFQAGGDNLVGLKDIEVGDDVQFRGGRGADRFGFLSGSVGDDMRVRTGNGHDSVFIESSPVGDLLDINTGSGHDKVGLGGDDVQYKDVTVKTGKGRDGILFGGMRVRDDLNVNMGSGSDVVFAGELQVDESGSFRLNLSGGNDDAYLFDSTIDSSVSVNGGSGFDGFETRNVNFAEAPSENGIERNFVLDADLRSLEFAFDLLSDFNV
ncbi:MAG: hypothetical protein AB8G99_19890 [Planctomycetaceae bacterium]